MAESTWRTLRADLIGRGSNWWCTNRATAHVVALREGADDRLQFALPPFASSGTALSEIVDSGHNTTALAMSGVPAPATWRELVALRSSSGFRPPLDIVEPDVDLLGVWLRVIDVADDLQGPRIGVHAGSSATEHLVTVLLDDPYRMAPSHLLVNQRAGAGVSALDTASFERVREHRRREGETCARAQEIRYGGRDATWWGRRFDAAERGERPLQIVGFTTRHSTVIRHAMRDLAHAFVARAASLSLSWSRTMRRVL